MGCADLYHILRQLYPEGNDNSPFCISDKTDGEVAIFQVLDEYLSFQRSITNAMPKEYFQLSTENSCKYVEMSDIYYFCYVQDRTVRVQMRKEYYIIKDSITNVYGIINHDYFLMPNSEFFGKHPAYSGD